MSEYGKFFTAYYFSLSKTLVPEIDAILKEICDAGRGAHHTEDWDEYGYPEKMQAAANAAAEHVKHLQQRIAELEQENADLRAKYESVLSVCPQHEVHKQKLALAVEAVEHAIDYGYVRDQFVKTLAALKG